MEKEEFRDEIFFSFNIKDISPNSIFPEYFQNLAHHFLIDATTRLGHIFFFHSLNPFENGHRGARISFSCQKNYALSLVDSRLCAMSSEMRSRDVDDEDHACQREQKSA